MPHFWPIKFLHKLRNNTDQQKLVVVKVSLLCWHIQTSLPKNVNSAKQESQNPQQALSNSFFIYNYNKCATMIHPVACSEDTDLVLCERHTKVRADSFDCPSQLTWSAWVFSFFQNIGAHHSGASWCDVISCELAAVLTLICDVLNKFKFFLMWGFSL